MLAMEENQEFEDLSTTLNNLSSADEESGDESMEESPKVEVVSPKKKQSKKRKINIVNKKEIALDHILFGNKEGLITNLRGLITDDIGQEEPSREIKSAW